MKKIEILVDKINEELCGAKEYAEEYLYRKSKGDTAFAKHYLEMANDELKHANYIHEIAVSEIDMLSKTYTPPVEMQEKWDKSHKKYVEKAAWIRKMLEL